MKRFFRKLANYLQVDAILRNWMTLSLWAGSVAFIVLSFFFDWTKEVKFTVALLVLFFNFLALRFIRLENDLRKEIGYFYRENVHVVEATDPREFYVHMTAAIKLAEQRADVTRLDQTKPAVSHIEELKEYYETAKRIIQKKDITFRRIIRIASPDVLEWTIELLEELGDCHNFSIAALQVSWLNSLSVQIVDDTDLLLVQPHTGIVGSSPQRNMLRIKGRRMTEAFSKYYDKVWSASTPIKDGQTIYWENLIEIAGHLLADAKQRNDVRSSNRISSSLKKLNDLAGIAGSIDS